MIDVENIEKEIPGELKEIEFDGIDKIRKQLIIQNKLKLLELKWNYSKADGISNGFEKKYLEIENEINEAEDD